MTEDQRRRLLEQLSRARQTRLEGIASRQAELLGKVAIDSPSKPRTEQRAAQVQTEQSARSIEWAQELGAQRKREVSTEQWSEMGRLSGCRKQHKFDVHDCPVCADRSKYSKEQWIAYLDKNGTFPSNNRRRKDKSQKPPKNDLP